jgi:hypothetical protein
MSIIDIRNLTLEEAKHYSKFIEHKYSNKKDNDEDVLDTTTPEGKAAALAILGAKKK